MRTRAYTVLHVLISLLFAAGLGLTILSYVKACTNSCVEVHHYKYFGLDFELLGLAFFIVAGLLHVFSIMVPSLGYIVGLMLAAAVGSEINFILIQKYVIGHYCPLCLTIAAVIGLISLLYATMFFYRFFFLDKPITWGKVMKAIIKTAGIILAAFIAYGVAFAGVAKPETSFAEGVNSEVPYFGNPDSQVEVYIFTDWFCPPCRRTEPKISPYYNRMKAKARVYFIDFPVNPETRNYIPYNLSFMLKNKDQYLNVRKALHDLSETNKTPSPEDVNQAVEEYGITYTPLNFSDIAEGIKFQEGVAETFKIRYAPTVVVANRKNLTAKKLTGTSITGDNILKAIDKVK